MQAALTKDEAMSFTRPPYLERIEWTDGTKSYCRGCDALVAFHNVGGGQVACEKAHAQHAGNLILNGTKS